MNEDKRLVEVLITLDIKKKNFRITDYDDIDYGGSINGYYVNKEDLIRIVSQYIRDYVVVEGGKSKNE